MGRLKHTLYQGNKVIKDKPKKKRIIGHSTNYFSIPLNKPKGDRSIMDHLAKGKGSPMFKTIGQGDNSTSAHVVSDHFNVFWTTSQ